jgi:hypothetical protein
LEYIHEPFLGGIAQDVEKGAGGGDTACMYTGKVDHEDSVGQPHGLEFHRPLAAQASLDEQVKKTPLDDVRHIT